MSSIDWFDVSGPCWPGFVGRAIVERLVVVSEWDLVSKLFRAPDLGLGVPVEAEGAR